MQKKTGFADYYYNLPNSKVDNMKWKSVNSTISETESISDTVWEMEYHTI